MKNIHTNPEFKALSEEEVVKALDEFESQFDDSEEIDTTIEPENPIVAEVARLINEYTNRFDELCESIEEEDLSEKLTEEVFNYEPEIIIEQVAFEIFLDAVHDAMQEEDDSE